MRRRDFLGVLSGAAAWPVVAKAQPAMPVIGFLHPATPAAASLQVTAFRQGLSETGRVEWRNVGIDFRWAESKYERLPELAVDLVRSKVAVIAALGGDPVVLAAKAATATIPVVFNTGSDPVKVGLVASLNRPGGNLTGVNQLTGLLPPKQIEILRQLLPTAVEIGLLANPGNPAFEVRIKDLQNAARALGLQLYVANATNENGLDAAFKSLAERHVAAFLVAGDAVMMSLRNRIVELAKSHSIPAVYARREFVTAGGLMSYGASLTDAYRLAGVYTGRILKGEKPAELPVQQSDKVELVINLRTAKALGLTIPPTLLARADEVVE